MEDYDDEYEEEEGEYEEGGGEGDEDGFEENVAGEGIGSRERADPGRINWYKTGLSMEAVIRSEANNPEKLKRLFNGATETYRSQSDFKDCWMNDTVMSHVITYVFNRVPSELSSTVLVAACEFMGIIWDEKEVSDFFNRHWAEAAIDAIERCILEGEYEKPLKALDIVFNAGDGYIPILESNQALIAELTRLAQIKNHPASYMAVTALASRLDPALPVIVQRQILDICRTFLINSSEPVKLLVCGNVGGNSAAFDGSTSSSHEAVATCNSDGVELRVDKKALEKAIKDIFYNVQFACMGDASGAFRSCLLQSQLLGIAAELAKIENSADKRTKLYNSFAGVFHSALAPTKDQPLHDPCLQEIATAAEQLGVLEMMANGLVKAVIGYDNGFQDQPFIIAILAMVIFSANRETTLAKLAAFPGVPVKLNSICRAALPAPNQGRNMFQTNPAAYTAPAAALLLTRFMPDHVTPEATAAAAEFGVLPDPNARGFLHNAHCCATPWMLL